MIRPRILSTSCVVACLTLLAMTGHGVHADFVWLDDSLRTNDNWSDPANWEGGVAPGAVVTEEVVFPTTTGTWGTSKLDDGDRELQAGLRIDRFRSAGTLDLGGNTLSITGGVSSMGGGRVSVTVTNGTMVFGSLSNAVSTSFFDTNFSSANDIAGRNVTFTDTSTVDFRNVNDFVMALGRFNVGTVPVTVDLSAASVVNNEIALNNDMIIGRYITTNTASATMVDGTVKLAASLTRLSVGNRLVLGENLRNNLTTATTNGTLDLGGGASLDLDAGSLVLGRGDRASGSIVNLPTVLNLSVGSLASRGVIQVGYNDTIQGSAAGPSTDTPAVGSLTSLGGAFDAYLTELRIGENTQLSGTGGAATGTMDMSAAVLGVLDISGDAVIGKGLKGVGVLRLTGDTAAVGQANSANLNVGSTSDGSSGLLELTNVRWAVSGAVVIEGSSGSDLGRVVTNVSGLSSGLDLGAAATLSVGTDGRIEIVFSDPSEDADGIYWGLRWSGDHVAELQALASAGLLTWDDSLLTLGDASIFEAGGVTYVGLVIPEPASVVLGIMGAVLLAGRRGRC